MKEERFSSGTPSKNKISNFGAISPLYPNFIYHSLSLTQFEGKWKKRKEERHLCSWTVHLLYIWHFESVSVCIVKDSCILMLPRGWSCSLPCLLRICYFIFPFQLLFALCYLALNCPINSFKISLLQYDIITTKPIGPYLPLSRGRKESDLVGVWIVWNLEPLASGGQSSPKLIPHIICQFLYAWEKNSERGLIL